MNIQSTGGARIRRIYVRGLNALGDGPIGCHIFDGRLFWGRWRHQFFDFGYVLSLSLNNLDQICFTLVFELSLLFDLLLKNSVLLFFISQFCGQLLNLVSKPDNLIVWRHHIRLVEHIHWGAQPAQTCDESGWLQEARLSGVDA